MHSPLVPLALIAELTHRCPLHCVYCSNPLEMQKTSSELSTEDWKRVFHEAARLGTLHVHLTGGEPLARPDLQELIASAHHAGVYTNLITSGIGLSEQRLEALVEAGLEHIQLSFQDSQVAGANEISGTRSHEHKIKIAQIIKRLQSRSPLAFTMNVVVHRQNMNRLPEIIALAEELSPDRLEIANVQYYGWALRNRDALLPTRLQLELAQLTVTSAQERLRGRMRIDYVAPDYYARYPKACMGGWGRRLLLIDPKGDVLPCHAAGVIPGMRFDNVREHPLQWIWQQSEAFQRYRGEGWMQEPCRSCERREIDFGGCRCQALLLAGDASATDPACSLSPKHSLIEEQLLRVNSVGGNPERGPARDRSLELEPADAWHYRTNPVESSPAHE